ncbi:MAG: hypothetical protein ACR2LL_02875 [Nitrosopumilus sp.]
MKTIDQKYLKILFPTLATNCLKEFLIQYKRNPRRITLGTHSYHRNFSFCNSFELFYRFLLRSESKTIKICQKITPRVDKNTIINIVKFAEKST